MSPAPRIAAFLLVVVIAFGVGAAVGAASGPIGTADDVPADEGRHDSGGGHP